MAFKCIPKNIADKLKQDLLDGKIGAEEIAKMLPEEKALVKSILEDFVSDQLGVKVKSEEVKVIKEKSAKIEAAQEKLGADIGNPAKEKENIEFILRQ